MMIFKQVEFVKSAAKLSHLPIDKKGEVAFAGRSNAGKSSAINAITGVKGLARTSKTPGRTQLINFFSLGASYYLVDLPGYGYAKVPIAVKERWQKTLAAYLQTRENLKGLVLVMDIRHPLKDYDQQMLLWAFEEALPVHILLTKCDKLRRGPAMNILQQVKQSLATYKDLVSIQLFSATNSTGVDEVRKQLKTWLD